MAKRGAVWADARAWPTLQIEKEQTMQRTKVLGLCLAALFAVSALAAAQASAIEFLWHVNGAKLTAGERALTSKAKGLQILKTSVIGVKVEIKCSETSTPTAKIIGGLPGTSLEIVEYKSCVVAKPSGCSIKGGTITTNPLKDEIVEGVGTSAGKALVLFSPESGKVFAEPKLEGGFLCLSLSVEGSVLAEAIPQNEEAEIGVLKFEPANGKEAKNSKGETTKDGLTVSGNAATVTGEVETTLGAGQKFGIF